MAAWKPSSAQTCSLYQGELRVIDLRASIPSGYTGRFIILNLDDVEGIAVHHSVSGWAWNPLTQRYTGQAWNDAVDAPPEAEVAHLLAIDRWHSLPNNDWGGFGYHLAAFASGRLYLCGSLNTARAHVAGLNKRFNGLVLIGDFTNGVPRQSHLEAAREGVAFIRAFHSRTLPVESHRLIRNQNTTCPGELYYKWVPGLNEAKEDDMAFTEEDSRRLWELYKRSRGDYVRVAGTGRVYGVEARQLTHILNPSVLGGLRDSFDDVRDVPPDDEIWQLPVYLPGGLPDELKR